MIFGDWHVIGFPIHGPTGRKEDQSSNARLLAEFEEAERRQKIAFNMGSQILGRGQVLAGPGEVEHHIDTFECMTESPTIAKFCFYKSCLRRYREKGVSGSVEYHNLPAFDQERIDEMRTNETETTGD